MTMIIDGTAGVTFPDTSVQGKAVPAAPQSMVRLNTANGYGSTNTMIRRFTNVVTNQGTDITYADSATLGASFTINTNGVYAISYNDQFTGVAQMALTLNTVTPTSNPASCALSEILAACYGTAANVPSAISVTAYLSAGAVVRAHTDNSASGTTVALCQFTITRVA